MSNCCNAKVINPSGEGIEGVCADCGEHCGVVGDSQFDEKLDEILKPLIGHDDGVEFGNGYHDECLEELTEAKQAIKKLIASELGAIIDANTDENGTDSDRVYEVLMEWIGELKGGER